MILKKKTLRFAPKSRENLQNLYGIIFSLFKDSYEIFHPWIFPERI